MLVLSYGITKSGSTLAFELAKAVLTGAGHDQTHLGDEVVEPGHHINFINRINREKVENLIAAIPEGSAIAVKTHAPFEPALLPWLDELSEAGRLKVHAIYRDPREICLSLLDAGESARAKGKKAFSEITTMDEAAANVQRQIRSFIRWASVKGALHLGYNTAAFDMDTAISAIAVHLGVEADPEAVRASVLEDAFTQKNKAVKDRYKDELTVRVNEGLEKTFKAFISHVCNRQNDVWFERQRARILAAAASKTRA